MTSCVAIAQLRPGRKIFNRQHLHETREEEDRDKEKERERKGQSEDRRRGESLTLAMPFFLTD